MAHTMLYVVFGKSGNNQTTSIMVKVYLTVFEDAVKMEIEQYSRRESIAGWFRDEVAAIGAALERVLMRSALTSELRKLPAVSIETRYNGERSGHPVTDFKRGTKAKHGALGRKIVLIPGSFSKPWLKSFCRDYTV